MSYSLNSFKGGYILYGTTIGVITRSLDYSSHDRPLAVKASISSGLGFIVGLLDLLSMVRQM